MHATLTNPFPGSYIEVSPCFPDYPAVPALLHFSRWDLTNVTMSITMHEKMFALFGPTGAVSSFCDCCTFLARSNELNHPFIKVKFQPQPYFWPCLKSPQNSFSAKNVIFSPLSVYLTEVRSVWILFCSFGCAGSFTHTNKTCARAINAFASDFGRSNPCVLTSELLRWHL